MKRKISQLNLISSHLLRDIIVQIWEAQREASLTKEVKQRKKIDLNMDL